jgi:hypothetical protein
LQEEEDNRPGRARPIYDGILRDYPDTQAAATARSRLNVLDANKKNKMMKK